MARAELIPTMTDEQLRTNERYARERLENNPEQTHWARLAELCEIQRHYNNKFAEYREACGRELPQPTAAR